MKKPSLFSIHKIILSTSRVHRQIRNFLVSALMALLAISGIVLPFAVQGDTSPQTLPFAQNWTTTTLITANDNWSGVPGIEGYLGQDITTGTGTDPQTLLGVSSVANDLDVIANQSAPNTLANGGVAEFDGIANPSIALNGSGTADAPYLLIYLNTTGLSTINVAYNLRDLDGSTDNAVQPVALQFRVGSSGNFTNVPAGFVADATTGPSLATLVTPVSVTLPAAAENQSLVQVRIMTANAVGNDEWVGIDDINITGMGGGSTNPSGTGAASPSSVVQGGSTLLTVTVTPGTNPASTGLTVTGDLTSIGGSATQPFFDNATNGDVISGDNIFSFQATVAPATAIGPKSLPITIADAQARMGSTMISLTVTSASPLRIHDIQGASHVSPVVGSSVSNVSGIVTAVRSNGFYIQDNLPDANDATSEAIFVFTSTAPPAAAALGNAVEVSGTVAEFGSGTNLTNTEITSPTVAVLSTGNSLPVPTVIGTGGRIPPMTIIDDDSAGTVGASTPFDPANDGIDFYESLEGMRVQINNAVAVGPTSDNNEIPVLGDNGVNASVRTSRGGIVVRATDFNPERIFIDDTLLAGSIPQVNVSDTFTAPIVGIMDYSGGNFRVLTTAALTAVSGGLTQEATTTPTANELAIATFNVENLDPGDPASKFNTLASLIVNNLKSPDIICVEEIQDNDGPTNSTTVDASQTFATLIAAIQTAGGPTYQFRQINPVDDQDGGEPGGNIRQGFMYRTDRGLAFIDRPGGGPTTSTTVVNTVDGPVLSASPGRIDPTNTAFNSSRKPLAGEFGFRGQKFFIIGNHFNSKGGDDPLFGRNQPPILSSEVQRNQQAQIVNNFVDAILALNANANIVVLGDINDFEFSTPVNTLKGGVLTPLIESLPQSERYSYNFEGNAQALDHLLVSNNLFNNVPFVYDVVHINSEFANQSSDHDPSVARFMYSPTAARLAKFEAMNYGNEVLLQWQTGEEVDNLGFNIYREEAGQRARLTPQLVAGSALVAGENITLSAGRTYSWWDAQANPQARYWLEAIDLNGKSAWHGPVQIAQAKDKKAVRLREKQAQLLSMMGRDAAQESPTLAVEPKATVASHEPDGAEQATIASSIDLAGRPAVKLYIKQTGMYRVSFSELIAAGLTPAVNPRMLQLFVDGQEVPFNVTGKSDSQLDSSSTIEFYGVGIDSAATDTRAYWLVVGTQPGKRMQTVKGAAGLPTPGSFLYTVERRDRTIYFSALRNGDKENFFGAVITRTPVDQSLTLKHLDPAASGQAAVEVTLQGVTQGTHRVGVSVNGLPVGEVQFDGQTTGTGKFMVPQARLKEGANQITLSSLGTENDISLVDAVRLSYWHTYQADQDVLAIAVTGKQKITIDGFTNNVIKVFDVTNPNEVQEIAATVSPLKGGFAATVISPFDLTRTFLAVSTTQMKRAARVVQNLPSTWRTPDNAADLLIVTHNSLLVAARELQTFRQHQGLQAVVVDIEDIFDEFSFGHKNPQAVKSFFAYAQANWQKAPRFAVMMGDASVDPKNYLGRGDYDFVPTRILDTAMMETASDDWFTESTTLSTAATIAIGRLPARGADEASRLVAKIIAYEQAPKSNSVLLISDVLNGFNFEVASGQLQSLIKDGSKVERIDRGQTGTAAAKRALMDAINRGQRLINYSGHASVDVWADNLLTATEARSLTNQGRLPLFVMMNCLNGYFADAALEPLAESLLKAERGGAIAVWASSGMTLPGEQTLMNQQLFRLMFNPENANLRLGELTTKAKASTGDVDVRRTWILFGDPSMRLK
jgi:predicted extracellular nuclease